MYLLRKENNELKLVKYEGAIIKEQGKVIATFADPTDEDVANTICNILNAEEQRWGTFRKLSHQEWAARMRELGLPEPIG